MSANVGLSPGEVAGYNGATIICTPKEDPSWYRRVGSYLWSGGGWFNRAHFIHARNYAEQGVITYSESEAEQKGSNPGERFVQDVTKSVLNKPSHRRVVVKFEDVTSCSKKIYELFPSIARVIECPFTCIVDADSSILEGLKKVGFPEKHLKVLKKKK